MNVRIGTCSWKYDSWRGIIYPESGKLNFLKEYAKVYNTVEIDQWFWSLFSPDIIKLPDTGTAKEYNDAVGKDFRFSIKVPNSVTLTHYYPSRIKNLKSKSERNPYFLSPEIFNRFLAAIEPLHMKTGALMLQFEYLNKNKMGSLNEFTDLLDNFFDQIDCAIPISIELRNPNYLKEPYFRFLNEKGVFNVFLQGYYMPDIHPLYQFVRNRIQGMAVIRLIGPDRKKIEEKAKNQWNRIVSPKDADLINIADIINDLEARGIKVFLNINNHYEGSAPLTIQKIKEIIETVSRSEY